MKRTTSNEDRVIVTTGSEHEAVAISPDVCVVPGPGAQPFHNCVESAKLQKGATTTTFIAGERVFTEVGELGPPSEPKHKGTEKGVSSGTYRDVATATSFSHDVFFEGGAVVRAYDATVQNCGNTKGVVVPSELAAELRGITDVRERCLRIAAAAGSAFIVVG